jgi:hypothetical protein
MLHWSDTQGANFQLIILPRKVEEIIYLILQHWFLSSSVARHLAWSFARAPPLWELIAGESYPLLGSRRGRGRIVTDGWLEDAVMVAVEGYKALSVSKVASWFYMRILKRDWSIAMQEATKYTGSGV